MRPRPPPHFRIVIVGSGFSGLGMAIRLKQEGIEDFVVLERAQEVGGVWRDNAYPGCACDVQSHLYSFSFAPNPHWSRAYSAQEEIHDYLRACAERFGLQAHLRFHHTLHDAHWDEESQRWHLETSQGPYTAQVFICATGALSEPSVPSLPGLETFAGKVMHSARWDPTHRLVGRRVAVVGTGASAIQFVPRIQPEVGQLTLVQRTPPWVLPRGDREINPWMRWVYRRVPGARRLRRSLLYAYRELTGLGFMNPWILRLVQRQAERHLRECVPDPALRERLTPRYTLGCKRVLVSDDYLTSLTRANVEVVTEAIREVRPHALVLADGTEREVDTLIFGTGFRVTDLPISHHIRGSTGHTLAQTWAGTMKAHLGTTVSGFPNYFMLPGPNTGLGHTSVLLMLESQIEHVLNALRYLEGRELAAVEPTPDAQARFVEEVDRRMARTVWTRGGCLSWYLDPTGRNSTLWPGLTPSFKRRVRYFDPAEYRAIAWRPPRSPLARTPGQAWSVPEHPPGGVRRQGVRS